MHCVITDTENGSYKIGKQFPCPTQDITEDSTIKKLIMQ